MENTFLRTREELLEEIKVDPNSGLTHQQASKRLLKYGRNELEEEESTPIWELILKQFKDTHVLVLLGAAVISFVLVIFEEDNGSGTAFIEPIFILLILIAKAAVVVTQESNTQKAIEALKKNSPSETRVVREGQTIKIPSAELVPGDIIELSIGDQIPADCRLLDIYSSSFRVDQYILTGDSVSVNKVACAISDVKAVKQDQINMVFSGTTVSLGKGRALVAKTGRLTAISDIHKSISSQNPEKVPLFKKSAEYRSSHIKFVIVFCILAWLINIRNFNDPSHHGWLRGSFYYFKYLAALALSATPKDLIVAVMACLALGSKRIAAKNAIVRSLPSVEALGCTSVICSNKTGTLTNNQMSVSRVLTVSNHNGLLSEYTVDGTTYAPEGTISTLDGQAKAYPASSSATLAEVALISSLCNDSSISFDESSLSYASAGEPTEAALKCVVEKLGSSDSSFNDKLASLTPIERVQACNDNIAKNHSRLHTMEFSQDRKSMSVVVSGARGNSLLVKGAPESVLARCTHVRLCKPGESQSFVVPLTSALRETLNQKVLDYGEKLTLRCLALASVENLNKKTIDSWNLSDPTKFESYESDLVFAGLIGMKNPPRPEVKDSIKKCHSAGIRVIVITGDNKKTAESICRSIGVFEPEEDLSMKSYTGKEFDAMSFSEKKEAVLRANLFSRIEPTQKNQLVYLLQDYGHVVAMTGDGVNDAPFLKNADIGVAMGSGTDVTRLAADMILADDNFTTIEKAIGEGRATYNNIKQLYSFSISLSKCMLANIFSTSTLGLPEALAPVQLLWLSLLTGNILSTGLLFNPLYNELMRRPPRNTREPIADGWPLACNGVFGIFTGVATIFGYVWWFVFYANGPQISYYQLTHFRSCSTLFPEIGCEMFVNSFFQRANTISFSVLTVLIIYNAFSASSGNDSLFTLPLWRNMYLVFAIILSMVLHFMIIYIPFFSNLFLITPLNFEEWQAVVIISFPVVISDEILKFITRNFIAPPPVPVKVKYD